MSGAQQWTFSVDSAACSGCKACQVACKDKHDLEVGRLWRRVYEVSGGEWVQNGPTWQNNVFAYHLSLSCNHCQEPICRDACPAGAISKRPDGIVLIDGDKCLGCGYCRWACPYGAPQYDAVAGCMTKCTLCVDLIDEGRPPACVAACPMRVLDCSLTPANGQTPVAQPFPLPAPELTRPALSIHPHPAARDLGAGSFDFGGRSTLPPTLRMPERDLATGSSNAGPQQSAAVAKSGLPALGMSAQKKASIANREEVLSQPLSGEAHDDERPLVAFTLLAQGVAGAVTLLTLNALLAGVASAVAPQLYAWATLEATTSPVTYRLVGPALAASRTLGDLSLSGALPDALTAWLLAGLIAIAMFISLFHLGHPERAYRAVRNLRSSWLSREILLTGLFTAGLSLLAFNRSLPAAPILGSPNLILPLLVLCAVLGLALVYSMTRIYRLSTVPVWNQWRTSLAFWCSTFLLGGAGLLMLAMVDPQMLDESSSILHWSVWAAIASAGLQSVALGQRSLPHLIMAATAFSLWVLNISAPVIIRYVEGQPVPIWLLIGIQLSGLPLLINGLALLVLGLKTHWPEQKFRAIFFSVIGSTLLWSLFPRNEPLILVIILSPLPLAILLETEARYAFYKKRPPALF